MLSFLKSRRRNAPPAMTLEGALGPNGRLDLAQGKPVDAPEAICVSATGSLLISSGATVLILDAWGADIRSWVTFDTPVTALCSSPGGLVAIGLAGGRLVVLDPSGQTIPEFDLPTDRVASIVDCVFRSEDELVLVDCGYRSDDNVLALATWEDEGRGQLVSLHRSGRLEIISANLSCPMGVCLDGTEGLLVSLLERAAIVESTGRIRQAGYPGYLGRLRNTGKGFALACLSRRDPLIEFLKTERAFIAEMKATVSPHHWIAPRANPEFSHDFPIELGATRLFGEVKPWAPSFSYGLLIELDGDLLPTGSQQSRANGRRHAICDVTSWNGHVIAVSKASGEILNLGAHLI